MIAPPAFKAVTASQQCMDSKLSKPRVAFSFPCRVVCCDTWVQAGCPRLHVHRGRSRVPTQSQYMRTCTCMPVLQICTYIYIYIYIYTQIEIHTPLSISAGLGLVVCMPLICTGTSLCLFSYGLLSREPPGQRRASVPEPQLRVQSSLARAMPGVRSGFFGGGLRGVSRAFGV